MNEWRNEGRDLGGDRLILLFKIECGVRIFVMEKMDIAFTLPIATC
jgi:hypothetical protein